ncbi:MAG: acetolactate synthase small subunit, partial [Planctomycetes bacterium]|nr:acetolactate synthase small subunit [Planctomycetota bacterium]
YKAKIVDYAADSLVLRLHGSTDKLDYCLDVLKQYEIVELVRSGKIVMARNVNKT